MTRIARRREAVALLVALISLAFVNPDIAAHREGDPVFQPAIRWGRLVELWNERRDVLEGRRIIAAYSYSPHSIVLTGGDVTFWFENSLVTPDTPAAWMNSDRVVTRSLMLPDVRFVASVDTAELRSARENGFAVVCPEPARKYVERLAGYRPEDHGIRIIPLQPEN